MGKKRIDSLMLNQVYRCTYIGELYYGVELENRAHHFSLLKVVPWGSANGQRQGDRKRDRTMSKYEIDCNCVCYSSCPFILLLVLLLLGLSTTNELGYYLVFLASRVNCCFCWIRCDSGDRNGNDKRAETTTILRPTLLRHFSSCHLCLAVLLFIVSTIIAFFVADNSIGFH